MRRIIIIVLLVTVGGCAGTSTPELLDADFVLASASQIDLQSPKNNAATDENPSLVWSARNGVQLYVVEVSESDSFSTLALRKEVSGTEYTLMNSDLIDIPKLKPIAYYWRVSTKSKKYPLTSRAYTLQILAKDVIYAASASTASLQVGNQTAPYKTIGAAISQATVTGQANIYVAQGTYNEDIQLKSNVSVYGGYNSNGWNRNTAVYTTIIARQGVAAVTCGSASNSGLDGFQIQIGTGATIYGMYLVNCQATINGNTFTNTGGSTVYGIYEDASTSGSISNNTFTLTNNAGTGSHYAAYLRSSSVSVSQNTMTLSLTNGGNMYGVYADTITGFSASGNSLVLNSAGSSALFGFFIGAGSANLQNNTITGSGNDIRGISANASVITATGNTVTTSGATSSFVGILSSSATGNSTMTGNNITMENITSSAQGFYVSGGAGSTLTASNNQIRGYCDGDCYGIDIGGSGQVTANDNTIQLSTSQNGSLYGLRSNSSTNQACEFSGNLVTAAGYSAVYTVSLGNTSGTTVAKNNVFASSQVSATSIPPINLATLGSQVVTNNTIVLLTASNNQQIGFQHGAGALITNNIFVTAGGANSLGIREAGAANDPRSFENNAFWDLAGAARFHFGNYTSNTTCGSGMTCYTDLTFESLTDWTGGTDKARGNIELTDGASGNPFVNIPSFIDEADVTGSTTTVRPAIGTPYSNGHCIEINRDGVMRTITAGGGTTTLTFSPAMSSSTRAGMEIRNWKTNCSNTNLSFKLQQNMLGTTLWQNLIYGGKNSSGNNCGAPAGGPGVGIGAESCGSVTTDKDGTTRTNANAGLATNTGAGGFSIGAYEQEN